MKKNKIRLNESQLQQIIKESVRKVLREGYAFDNDGISHFSEDTDPGDDLNFVQFGVMGNQLVIDRIPVGGVEYKPTYVLPDIENEGKIVTFNCDERFEARKYLTNCLNKGYDKTKLAQLWKEYVDYMSN